MKGPAAGLKSGYQRIFQLLKWNLLFLLPAKGYLLSKQFVEGLCNNGESKDELSVISGKDNEALKLFDIH